MRLKLLLQGRVQGVGFRPSIYRFAAAAGVGGFVRNTLLGAVIEVEGALDEINRFGEMLEGGLPPLARIDTMDITEVVSTGETTFEILPSEAAGAADALFPVDTAVCGDCLREMNDPGDRRYRYPFINCTNCGPRFTIIEGLPYDRPLTTMREFDMDDFCRSQHTDRGDRRFHAEPISCPGCGPRVSLIDDRGNGIEGDAIAGARELLRRGSIVAVKGLGGYHLACRADEPHVVLRLRERKRRPVKPFAVMFRGIDILEQYCVVDRIERRLLLSPESPIVLLGRGGKELPEGIAPGNAYIGAFLPYTPVHHLLMEDFDVLVMTSANFTDEPLISNENELHGILGSIADAAVVHNRRIAHKCDDSIFFVPAGEAVPVRRARGYVPEPIRMVHASSKSILAVGGQEKGTFAVSKSDRAFLSPHLGDLGDIRSQNNFRSEIDEFKRMLNVEPEAVVCDMHPDYFTTRYAEELGAAILIPVQHHHAHAVGVMVEHDLKEPVIGVSFDGTGYGSDGKLWGGEFLLARYADFNRLAHLKYIPLPGGEAAVREPWRMALMHVWKAVGDGAVDQHIHSGMFEGFPAAKVLELARRGINAPDTSSIGRLFDAAAFLLGCGARVTYEAEAAVALEALARGADEARTPYGFTMTEGEAIEIDPAPVINGILDDIASGVAPSTISAAFHQSVARMIVDLSARLAGRFGCGSVVLSGGVFQNRLLVERVLGLAGSLPYEFYQHWLVPPNDGGISLGQVQIGAARIKSGTAPAS